MVENASLEPTSEPGPRKSIRWLLLFVVLAALGATGYWWFFLRNQVDTDDAYVKADSAAISSRVPGTVLHVLVANDCRVDAGQTLVELDPADYQVAVDRAQAVLAEAEAEVKAAEVSISQIDAQTAAQVSAADAALKAAQDREREARHRLGEIENQRQGLSADVGQMQRDYVRYESLFKQQAGTQRQMEQSQTSLTKGKAQLAALGEQTSAVKATLSAVGQEIDRAKAQLRVAQSARTEVDVQLNRINGLKAKRDKAKADLDSARLNLSYCTIKAPLPGSIAQKSVQVGERVQPGEAFMAVVPLQALYIEANFKETQLTHVRVGQPATIKADIYPGQTFHGKVVGIRAGTGAAFSLLPPENATGNWIKIVQRVPVKVLFDPPPPSEFPLRVGLSLEVTIHTGMRNVKAETRKDEMGESTKEAEKEGKPGE